MSILKKYVKPSSRNLLVASVLGSLGLCGAFPGLFWFAANAQAIADRAPLESLMGLIGVVGLGLGYLGLCLAPWYLWRRAEISVAGSLIFWLSHAGANLCGAIWAILALAIEQSGEVAIIAAVAAASFGPLAYMSAVCAADDISSVASSAVAA